MSNPPNSPISDRSEADLAALVARRDATLASPAFEELHQRRAARLASYLAARLDRSSVEAAAREVWSNAWDALGDPERFDGQDFGVLLRQIAHDHVNRPELADSRLDHGGEGEAIARGIGGLHPGERAVVEARLGGLTFEEIAARAKSTADRAEKVYAVARKKLNASLELEPPQS